MYHLKGLLQGQKQSFHCLEGHSQQPLIDFSVFLPDPIWYTLLYYVLLPGQFPAVVHSTLSDVYISGQLCVKI